MVPWIFFSDSLVSLNAWNLTIGNVLVTEIKNVTPQYMIAFAKGEHITFFVNHQSDPEISAERILCVQTLHPRDSPFSREPRWIKNRPLGSFKHMCKKRWIQSNTLQMATSYSVFWLPSFSLILTHLQLMNDCFALLYYSFFTPKLRLETLIFALVFNIRGKIVYLIPSFWFQHSLLEDDKKWWT